MPERRGEEEEERKKGKKKKKEKWLRLKARSQQSSYFALIYTQINTMQSIAQVQNVQKINAVSTGKVANEKSMMVWRPHGNKYVSIPNFPSSRVFDFWEFWNVA